MGFQRNIRVRRLPEEFMKRMRIVIRGAVQGVGFRPFIYRLSRELCLAGWVRNSTQGVFIEVEGEHAALNELLLRIEREKPPRSFITSLEYSLLEPEYFNGFEILESETEGAADALIPPDVAVCDDCLAEMYDPKDRRYRYPFINCTHCGPRFSIIESLPYDRPNTSMKSFPLCPDCIREYEDPEDRRFHAQPIACPTCGPEIRLWDETGLTIVKLDEALIETANLIRQGKIAAVKGLGGFHLICDAQNTRAVELLRLRKRREEKPFALMYPSLEAIEADCRVSPLEQRLVRSPEAPIVLLERREKSCAQWDPEHTTFEYTKKSGRNEGAQMSRSDGIVNSRRAFRQAGRRSTKRGTGGVSTNVAAGNPYLGVMLPSTPLYHLLMKEINSPVVATSGNLSDEPLCIDEREALSRLSGIADVFLVHNRPIVRHIDDSIVRIVLDRELVLRRARGYAPLPFHREGIGGGVLAVGGHLKNTIALSSGDNIFLSQHIGDLENKEAVEAFHRVTADFRRMYPVDLVRVVADMHPEYISAKAAGGFGVPVVEVQHHHAHVAACMAENKIDGAAMGVAWDGTGYGTDGSVWGGEFLLTDDSGFRRVATFRKFHLPGGPTAIREPRRSAMGLLYEIFGNDCSAKTDLPPVQAFTLQERALICRMLEKEVHSPWTTSAGRLFDAAASLCGLRQKISFEGQAAMELEFAAMSADTREIYPFDITSMTSSKTGAEIAVVDWEGLIRAIARDVGSSVFVETVARKFHNTLAEIILTVARQIGETRVVLSGGCFQNRVLLEETVNRLQNAGFHPFWHQRVPPGDGGVALGQIVASTAVSGHVK